MNDEPQKNYRILKAKSEELGAVLFGVAEIERMKPYFLLSDGELNGMRYGISIGIMLSRRVLQGIDTGPTLLYKWHYRQANILLDRIAFDITQMIMHRGYGALPIPASQVVDWEKKRGHVSHRLIGESAGLGWRGKNNLLVNASHGSQIRLVTILTDIPLETDSPVPYGCGTCRKCISACPACAIGESAEKYSLEKCYGLLESFSRMKGIGVHICGICVKVCQGKRSREKRG